MCVKNRLSRLEFIENEITTTKGILGTLLHYAFDTEHLSSLTVRSVAVARETFFFLLPRLWRETSDVLDSPVLLELICMPFSHFTLVVDVTMTDMP